MVDLLWYVRKQLCQLNQWAYFSTEGQEKASGPSMAKEEYYFDEKWKRQAVQGRQSLQKYYDENIGQPVTSSLKSSLISEQMAMPWLGGTKSHQWPYALLWPIKIKAD